MKKIIFTDSAPKAIGPYSQAVEGGGMVFLSGQIPLDPSSGLLAADDIKLQTERVLKNMEAVLKSCGLGLEDVVKTTVFMTNLEEFPLMNEVYAGFFREKCPARATVQVSALPKGARVEIEAIAVRE